MLARIEVESTQMKNDISEEGFMIQSEAPISTVICSETAVALAVGAGVSVSGAVWASGAGKFDNIFGLFFNIFLFRASSKSLIQQKSRDITIS